MVANALRFKRTFDGLARGAAPQVSWKDAGYHVKKFEFDSPIQRGVPADKVRGFVYFPQSYDKPCDLKFPATLQIHKLATTSTA
ncbi:MAG: hypothetical protein KGJ84_05135 [Elusimicrobia bacterium]|nr:hypothetical protein [Elusimicrobiota bacterium]